MFYTALACSQYLPWLIHHQIRSVRVRALQKCCMLFREPRQPECLAVPLQRVKALEFSTGLNALL